MFAHIYARAYTFQIEKTKESIFGSYFHYFFSDSLINPCFLNYRRTQNLSGANM